MSAGYSMSTSIMIVFIKFLWQRNRTKIEGKVRWIVSVIKIMKLKKNLLSIKLKLESTITTCIHKQNCYWNNLLFTVTCMLHKSNGRQQRNRYTYKTKQTSVTAFIVFHRDHHYFYSTQPQKQQTFLYPFLLFILW